MKQIKRILGYLSVAICLQATGVQVVAAQQCRYTLPTEVVQRFGDALSRRFYHDIEDPLYNYLQGIGHQPYRWNSGPTNLAFGDLRSDLYWVRVRPRDENQARHILWAMANDYGYLFENLGDAGQLKHQIYWPPSRWRESSESQNLDRQVGDIAPLDIYGPDNGTVAYTEIEYERGYFAAITVYDSRLTGYGTHPVNGNREWGYVRANNGDYYFYTASIETATAPLGGLVGSVLQDWVWHALLNDLYGLLHGAGTNAAQGSYLFLEHFWRDRISVLSDNRAVSKTLAGMEICANRENNEIQPVMTSSCPAPNNHDKRAWCEYGRCARALADQGATNWQGGKTSAETYYMGGVFDHGFQGGGCDKY